MCACVPFHSECSIAFEHTIDKNRSNVTGKCKCSSPFCVLFVHFECVIFIVWRSFRFTDTLLLAYSHSNVIDNVFSFVFSLHFLLLLPFLVVFSAFSFVVRFASNSIDFLLSIAYNISSKSIFVSMFSRNSTLWSVLVLSLTCIFRFLFDVIASISAHFKCDKVQSLDSLLPEQEKRKGDNSALKNWKAKKPANWMNPTNAHYWICNDLLLQRMAMHSKCDADERESTSEKQDEKKKYQQRQPTNGRWMSLHLATE